MLIAAAVFAQTIEYPHVQDNGGGFKTDATYRSYASIGQPVIGNCGNASYINQVGYLTGISCCVKIEEQPNTGKLPEKPTIGLPYPNPFNSVCNIEIALPEPEDVVFQVFDLNGHKVFEFLEHKVSGVYAIKFIAGNELSSGIYLYSVHIGGYAMSGKMTFVK